MTERLDYEGVGPGQQARVSDPLSILLQDVEWGPKYPLDLLTFTPTEQVWVSQRGQDGAQKGPYQTKGANTVSVAAWYGMLGKQEIQRCLEAGEEIDTLTQHGRRVVVLNAIFGKKWNIKGSVIATYAPERIAEVAAYLDAEFDNAWRCRPNLCSISQATLERRTTEYDKSLGRQWRSFPQILSCPDKERSNRIQVYDDYFGVAWRARPTILTSPPRTIIPSARGLQTVNITIENTALSSYFGLLTTTTRNKRDKIAAVRSQVLSHTQIYANSTNRSLASIVSERQQLTEADVAVEARELAELRYFMQRIGARGLVKSVKAIKQWADVHYHRPTDAILEALLLEAY